jgi:hypothetical protein
VIYDEIKKCHENFVIDQRISCSGIRVGLRYGVTMHTKYHRMLDSNEQAYLMIQSFGIQKPNFLTQTRVQHFSNLHSNLARL